MNNQNDGVLESLSKLADEVPLDNIPALQTTLGGIVIRLASRSASEKPSKPEQDNTDDDLQTYTAKEVAGFLKVTVQYVYDLMRNGKLPFFWHKKYKRIRHQDLRDFIDRHCENSVDGNIYLKYNNRHAGERTKKDSKATKADASTIRGPNRRQKQYRGAVGTRRPADQQDDSTSCAATIKGENPKEMGT